MIKAVIDTAMAIKRETAITVKPPALRKRLAMTPAIPIRPIMPPGRNISKRIKTKPAQNKNTLS